jgi:hypothetical protein
MRSNADWFGLSGLTDTAAATTSAKANAVAVPVEYGDVFSKVTFVNGATAQATSTHGNVALYSGGVAAPAILGAQSADNIAANGGFPGSALVTVTLGAPVLITPANAPFGYIYVSYGNTATTQPSLAAYSTPTAINYQWALNSATANPLAFAFNATGGGAVAPATLAGTAVAASAFLVFLS